MRTVDDRERRARLAVRHALHPDHRVPDPVAAARAMTVLHATEAATVHLAVRARTDPEAPPAPEDVDRVLGEDRSLVKQLAMRRTLFVLPRDLLPAVLGSASARVAQTQRRALVRDVERHGVAPDGEAWVDRARSGVLDRLTGAAPTNARQLREELPELAGQVVHAPGKSYGGAAPLAPRVLTLLGAEGLVVRGPNAGHWRLNRPTWVLADEWLGGQVEPTGTAEGYAELVRRWLRTFGPGTLEDLQWWLGSTRTAARAALAAVDAVQVVLDDGSTAWLLPDDLDPVGPVEPWQPCCPRSTRRRWAGGDGTSTSTRGCGPSCSTPTATRAPRPGGTAGSSGRGSRTTRARCRWWPPPTSACRPRPAGPWTSRPTGSPGGWTGSGSAPSTPRR
nr:crosslink repair DNA glycosylase YcaQ family protein [uncultured Ornithinimicrobium sp.]